MRVHGYAALKKDGTITPVQFDREPLKDGEVSNSIGDIADIDSTFEKTEKKETRFRHVIDMATLGADDGAEEIDPPVLGAVVS